MSAFSLGAMERAAKILEPLAADDLTPQEIIGTSIMIVAKIELMMESINLPKEVWRKALDLARTAHHG